MVKSVPVWFNMLYWIRHFARCRQAYTFAVIFFTGSKRRPVVQAIINKQIQGQFFCLDKYSE